MVSKTCNMEVDGCVNFIMVIISQYISNHHIVNLKLIIYYMSIIFQ